MIPVAQHPEALEVGPLSLQLAPGIVAAGLPERRSIQLVPDLALLLLHLQLDGQAVAVPAGHVGRIKPRQGATLDDDVLQDLVDRGAQMNRAVGVGRAVMQDEDGSARRGPANLAVDVVFLPGLEHLRLALGQIGPHGKRRPGQINGVLVVGHGGPAGSVGSGGQHGAGVDQSLTHLRRH